jgi:hypothetical protein
MSGIENENPGRKAVTRAHSQRHVFEAPNIAEKVQQKKGRRVARGRTRMS